MPHPGKASEKDLPVFTPVSIACASEMIFQPNRNIVDLPNRQQFTAGILSHHVGEVGCTPVGWKV